jgi:hypothetical protein
MRRVLEHLRHHALAATALVCSLLALAGASYAALAVPPHSVGERQLQNHSINPVKLNRQLIGGYVRHWAEVDGQGNVLATSGPVRVTHPSFPSGFTFRWRDVTPARFQPKCTALVTVAGGSQGYAVVTADRANEMSANTYTNQWQPSLEPISAAVIC